jgi:hypothetical protein
MDKCIEDIYIYSLKIKTYPADETDDRRRYAPGCVMA